MKYILSLSLILIVISYSCSKSDSVVQQPAKINKSNRGYHYTQRMIPGQLQKSFNLLVAKLKSGNIGYEVFYSELQTLLAPYKMSKPRKKFSIFSSRFTGSWNYIPPPCDFENDPSGCSEFWYSDCMSFCQESFYFFNEANMMEEEAATAEYFEARQLCSIDTAIKTQGAYDTCMAKATAAFVARMAPVITGYNWCNNELYLCESNCGTY